MELTSPIRTGYYNIPVLTDRFGRTLDYLRLAVTERCNLRCTYCMPAEGILLKPKDQILSSEELLRLVRISVGMGVKKVRITGGEPMNRKGIVGFLKELNQVPGLAEVHLTSNGFWSQNQIDEIDSVKLAGINFSLDSLKPERFEQITRRDAFGSVWATIMSVLDKSIPIKINTVLQRGVNDDELIALSKLAQKYPVDVRFIEQMPFNGSSSELKLISAGEILRTLKKTFPLMHEQDLNDSTANLYKIPGFKGRVGIIAGYSRTFCSTCNRLRITSAGHIKTCLYENGYVDLRRLLRNGSSDKSIATCISEAIQNKAKDGFETVARGGISTQPSMSTIGG